MNKKKIFQKIKSDNSIRIKGYNKTITKTVSKNKSNDKLFGIWNDREDFGNINSYIREIRKNRFER